MAKAKKGDTVKVAYTGKLEDGAVFDKSTDENPLEFKLGEGMVIPGFEEAVEGMEEKNSKTVTIASDRAYGDYHDGYSQEIARDQLPQELDVSIGTPLRARTSEDKPITVWVTQTNDANITVDANHPLAGKNLVFDIELLEVK